MTTKAERETVHRLVIVQHTDFAFVIILYFLTNNDWLKMNIYCFLCSNADSENWKAKNIHIPIKYHILLYFCLFYTVLHIVGKKRNLSYLRISEAHKGNNWYYITAIDFE